jgi:hypothetical protein
MGLLPSFAAWPFAVAGLLAAAGPLIIHLLNRRRFRVVHWAAMDFLRQAFERQRRILRLRDLLLLLLRTAAVLLVGLALAQPFFSRGQEAYDGSAPLHCVLVIDNSLSMSYETLEGTLLDEAKQRARQLIERLPADSRASVIPLCGSRWGSSPDALAKDDALLAIQQIEIVDRAASVQQMVNEARRACQTEPQLAKRVVFFSDQQASNWAGLSVDSLEELPVLQIIEIGPRVRENTWISDFRLQDGVADIETPAVFQVELKHLGRGPRENLQVTLAVDDIEVASQTVTLEPGFGAREVTFTHTFQGYRPATGRTVPVPVRVSITPDRLPGDDHRSLVAPVVSSLPIVFVDQYGAAGEDVRRNRLGETRPLRRLLAPVTSRSAADRQSIRLRHVTLEQLDRSLLEEARLVVIAGVADPSDRVPLLREFVQQGGQLLIAAGGRFAPGSNSGFDPMLWTSRAWLDGAGILPAPLLPELLGELPEQAGDSVRPFRLAFDSLAADGYFHLAGVDEPDLRGLYAEPIFFQAVRADLSAERIADAQPRVLARFDDPDASPYLIERNIGDGTVLFAASGLLPEWNTLATTNAVLILDRMLRSMIRKTLPVRNFSTTDRITLPLPTPDREIRVVLQCPGEPPVSETLDVGYIGREQLGLSVEQPFARGIYRIAALRTEADGRVAADETVWEIPLAVNGDGGESDLQSLTREQFERRVRMANARWVGPRESISLAGVQIRGQDSWWWLILTVLVLLLLELAILGFHGSVRGRVQTAAVT